MILAEIARELESSGVGAKDIFTILTEIGASMDELGSGDLRTTLMKIIVGCIGAIEHIDRCSEQHRQTFDILGDTPKIAEKSDDQNENDAP
jgi:hypothetical protein